MALSTVYCTDEDLLIRAPGDYALLAKGQEYATGKDGVFASDDRWTLTSVTVDFAGQAVTPGMVALVSKAGGQAIGGSGVAMVVDAVPDGGLTLRRRGGASGAGQPPGDVGGMTGVTFSVFSLAPQIEDVSYEINQTYGIDAAVSFRTATDLYDARQLNQLCVLTVLHRLYLDSARGKDGDVFYTKAAEVKVQIEELSAKVAVRWAGLTEDANPPTTKFGMRISR